MKKYLSIIFLMFTYFLFAQNLAIEYKGPNFNYNLELKDSVAKLQTVKKTHVPILYFDLKNKKHYFEMDKNVVLGLKSPHLIEISNNHKWEITTESRDILGYKCFKATTTITFSNKLYHITAWYTPNLPYSVGPTSYANLPGVILKITSSDFKDNYHAVSIKKKVVQKNIEVPSHSIITYQKFTEIVEANTGIKL